jgi:vancomycin permeability regulator SanA
LLVYISMKLLRHIYFRVLILGVLSMVLAGCFTYTAQKKFNKALYQTPYDAIIVPGVPLENGMWSPTMKARVYWSVYLYKKGIAKNIIYSGSAVYTPYIEAQVMALYAEQLGVPKGTYFYRKRSGTQHREFVLLL